MTSLNVILQRMETLPPTEVWYYHATGGPCSWFQVSGPEIAQMLAISDANVTEAVQTIGALVTYWSQIRAVQQRVLEHFEREEAVWKARQRIGYVKTEAKVGNKVATKDLQEDLYRTDPGYVGVKGKCEAARERLNFVDGIVQGCVAKRDALRFWYGSARLQQG